MKKASDSTYAVWHDPSTYDPLTMGPPYLPQSKTRQVQASAPFGPESTLSTILRQLRALSFIYQTYHWESVGGNFYGDHLLFERLYNETLPMIDALAERIVGLQGPGHVDPNLQLSGMLGFLSGLTLVEGASVQNAHNAVDVFLRNLASDYEQLKASGQLSLGLDNLLQDIADKHETFVYLLKQRSTSYRR